MINSPSNGWPRREVPAAAQQLGLAGCIAAVLVTIALVIVGKDVSPSIAMPLFLLLVTILSHRFGLRIGLATTVLSCITLLYFFLPPIFRLWASQTDQKEALVIFFVSAVIVGLTVSQAEPPGAEASASNLIVPDIEPATFVEASVPSVPQATILSAANYSQRNLVLDIPNRSVFRTGEEIVLTPKEFDLLLLLARKPGQLLKHDWIVDEVWGPAFDRDSHVLRTYIKQLRAKLADSVARPNFIRTEHGLGYRFVGEDCVIVDA